MAHAGQEIRAADGFALRLLTVEPELLAMEASYPGNGRLPPEHLHPSQSERFEVLEGQIRAIVGGEEASYAPGEVFDVPPGTPHQMTADSPSRVRWEVRPALRTAEFFERLHGDGPGSAREAASIAGFLAEFSDEIRFTGG